MNKETTYPKTGIIALLFMVWFLIIPLIWGIVLWKRQNKMNAQYKMDIGSQFQAKEKEIYQRKLKIEEANKQVIDAKRHCKLTIQQREKEIGVQALAERLQFLSVINAKMESFEKEAIDTKKAWELKEKEWHEQIVQKELAFASKMDTDQAIFDAIIQQKQQLITRLEEVVEERKERVQNVFKMKYEKIDKLNQRINDLKREVIDLEDEALYQLVGIYKPRFDFASSELYAERLKEIREAQKHMMKDKTATIHSDNWTLHNSLRKGRALNNQNIKMAIRSFNHECDGIIQTVKFNNIDVGLNKIQSAFEKINQLNKYNKINIHKDYLDLKIQELHLAYEYA